ncbi:MAG: NAD-dependent epimerase/dehydratase family protein [Pirellulaceae bacterium]
MIFVTGGTGLLGNTVVRELIARGHHVRVLCRRDTSRDAFSGLDVDVVEGDLSNEAVLLGATDGCEAVIHSAAMIHIGWTKLATARAVNVVGTQSIVDACLHHRAKLIYVSTVDTLFAALDKQHPISESSITGIAKTACNYVISKTEAEQLVRSAIAQRGLDAVIIHPGFMLGPYDWKPSSGRMMIEVNRAPIVAAPSGGCSLCDARDVAAAIVNAITMGESGQNYILAGDNLTYQEMWTEMLQTTGRQRRVRRLGGIAKIAGTLIDAAVRLLPIGEGDVNGAAISMGSLNHYYDSSKAATALHYHRRPRAETLTDAWQWLSQLPG